jgi:uncharacterized membrane-anchored protein
MKIYIPILFCVLCAAQWYVPLQMIAGQENIHEEGRVFRFKTQPVDPSDPFRGKYITLSFEADTFEKKGEEWVSGEKIFVLVKEDQDGFAAIGDVFKEEPRHSADYVEAFVSYQTSPRFSAGKVHVRYPFDRFYMEESKAKPAEDVYWEANSNDSTQVAYAVVHIKNGKASLSDVIINDRSIVDIVRELNAGEK